MPGPCDWTLDWSTLPCGTLGTDTDRTYAEGAAAGLLWRLSGRIFGVCTETVRPCVQPRPHRPTYQAAPLMPWLGVPGISHGDCRCTAGHACAGLHEIALPGPVQSVTSVWVDAVELDADAYKVRDMRWLLRVDGQPWPRHQDLTVDDHADGAFTVTYERGVPLPADGQVAFGDLACELLRARVGGACKIPSRAQQVSRQGVDIQLIDPAVLYEHGLTGVDSVDRWLTAVNPSGQRSQSAVYSPDMPQVTQLS